MLRSILILFAGFLTQMSLGSELDIINLTKTSLYLTVDKEEAITPEAVWKLSQEKNTPFQNSQELGHLEYSRKHLWVYIKLENSEPQQQIRYLYLKNPLLLEANIYSIDDKHSRKLISLGRNHVKTSPIWSHHSAVAISLKAGEKRSFLIHMHSMDKLDTPIFSYSEQAFRILQQKDAIFNSIVFGILGGIFLYNLFLTTIIKEKVFVLYCFFSLSLLLSTTMVGGYTDWLLQVPITLSRYSFSVAAVTVVASALFMLEFFKNTELSRHQKMFFQVSVAWFTLLIILNLLLKAPELGYVVDLSLMLYCSLGMYINITKACQGYKPAYFTSISLSCLSIMITVWIIGTYELIPSNIFVDNALAIGVVLEAILISLGLAYRYKVLRLTLESNLAQQNRILEEKVAERSAIIAKQKTQELEDARSHYVGQLAAGVAHEINNPLAIIQGSLDIISTFSSQLPEKVSQFIGKTEHAVDRIKHITTSLRVYAGHDIPESSNDCSVRQIKGGIYALMGQEMERNNIQMRLVSDSEEDSLGIDYGYLLQIVLPIIHNGIDFNAPDEADEMWIQIKVEEKKIRISNSAPAVPPKTIKHIFAPFFTTKKDGKGLGLFLAQSIAGKRDVKIYYDESSPCPCLVVDWSQASISLKKSGQVEFKGA